MEEETNGSWNSNKRLLEFLCNNVFYNSFDVGTDICIVILSELSRSQVGEEENTHIKWEDTYEQIESTHLFKN